MLKWECRNVKNPIAILPQMLAPHTSDHECVLRNFLSAIVIEFCQPSLMVLASAIQKLLE